MENGQMVQQVFDDRGLVDKPIGELRRALDRRIRAFPGTEGHFNSAKRLLGMLNEVMISWREVTKE